MMNGNKHIKL